MVIAAIATRPSTPPTTLPAITAVLFVEDDVDASALALTEITGSAAAVVEEVGGTFVEEEDVREDAEEVVEDCWADEGAEFGEAVVGEATDAALDTVGGTVDAAVDVLGGTVGVALDVVGGTADVALDTGGGAADVALDTGGGATDVALDTGGGAVDVALDTTGITVLDTGGGTAEDVELEDDKAIEQIS